MNALPEDPDVVLPDETPSPDEAPEPEPEPTPTPEPDPEPEPEPEPTPEPAPPSEKEIEALHKKLEKEAERHAARIGDIMGDDATALVVCELCDANTPGFHWPADVYPDDDPRLYVLRLLQGDTGEEMRHPDYLQTCEECNGYGVVLTGARTDNTRQIACPVCEFAGYIDTRKAPAAVVPLVAPSTGNSEQAANPSDDVQRDLAGRPDGHPRFWKLDAFLTPAEWQADKDAGYAVSPEFIGVPE